MLKLRKINEEVFIADEYIVQLGAEHIHFLKSQARLSPRKRARICTHRSNDDVLHEMFISILPDSYIHPHKHISKSESFYILEGLVDVVLFDDSGSIVDVVELGDVSTGNNFYYRLSDSLFHTLIVRSDHIVLHEVTNGPFVPHEALLAPFAPPDSMYEDALEYMEEVKRAVDMRGKKQQEKKSK